MTSPAARQPQGSPASTGGQFAPSSSPVSSVELDQLDAMFCAECGGDIVIETGGISHHLDQYGDIDHDKDQDHVPLDENQVVETVPRHALAATLDLPAGRTERLGRWSGIGFAEDAGQQWRDHGLTIGEARSWIANGFSAPGVARRWRDLGHTPETAFEWQETFGSTQAPSDT